MYAVCEAIKYEVELAHMCIEINKVGESFILEILIDIANVCQWLCILVSNYNPTIVIMHLGLKALRQSPNAKDDVLLIMNDLNYNPI